MRHGPGRGSEHAHSVVGWRTTKFGLVWCDWNPAESDVEEIAENISAGEAFCTKREVVAVVDRPQDIEDEEAMAFLGEKRAMQTKVRGRS